MIMFGSKKLPAIVNYNLCCFGDATYCCLFPSSVTVADGTAVSGEDYVPTAGLRVSFSSGEASKEVNIPIIDDDVIESDESIQLSLQLLGPSRPSARIGSPASATVKIIDNDKPRK